MTARPSPQKSRHFENLPDVKVFNVRTVDWNCWGEKGGGGGEVGGSFVLP
jgi:hypothetical protein